MIFTCAVTADAHPPIGGRIETRPGRGSAVSLFLICLAVYHANGRPHPEVDCVAAPYTAWSLVRNGSLDVRFYPELRPYVGVQIRELADGSWISARAPGSALAVVPFIAPFAALHAEPLRPVNMHHLGKLSAAVSVAGAAVFFFLICRRLAAIAAWPATLLFAFGTGLWSVASQASWMHGPATFWLCCGLYLLTRGDAGQTMWRLAAGAALGLAVLTRPTTAFFAVATAGALMVNRRWYETVIFGVGAMVPVSGLLLLNWTYFGAPLLGGYVDHGWASETPLWVAIAGLLAAPSRGVLVYSPALILIVPGIVTLVRRRDRERGGPQSVLLAWLMAAAATVWLNASYPFWWGGWSYGPRLMLETMPVLCLVFAWWYASVTRHWQRTVARALVVLSIAVHAVGVFGYGAYAAWHVRHDGGRGLFDVRDTQIEAHTRAVFRKLQDP